MSNPQQVVHENNIPWHMPEELILEIMSWEKKSKSPYSHSYYNVNAGEKDWHTTPLGSLRVSDHWNFTSQGKVHCPTDVPVANNRCWTLARWDGEKYIVVKTIDRVKLTKVPRHRTTSMNAHQRKTWTKYQEDRQGNG